MPATYKKTAETEQSNSIIVGNDEEQKSSSTFKNKKIGYTYEQLRVLIN
jgi:hypothetical protein